MQATHMKHAFLNNAFLSMDILRQQANTAGLVSTALPATTTHATSAISPFGLGAPMQSPSFGALPMGLAGAGYAQSLQQGRLPGAGFSSGNQYGSLEANILRNNIMAEVASAMQDSFMNQIHKQEEQKRANIASGLSLWA